MKTYLHEELFHNPKNVTPEQVGQGWRLMLKEEIGDSYDSESGIEGWSGNEWVKQCHGASKSLTYRVQWPLPAKYQASPQPLNLPEGLPQPPEPPEGMRWDYRGAGWRPDRVVIYSVIQPSFNERDWSDVFTRFPDGTTSSHYLEAVPIQPEEEKKPDWFSNEAQASLFAEWRETGCLLQVWDKPLNDWRDFSDQDRLYIDDIYRRKQPVKTPDTTKDGEVADPYAELKQAWSEGKAIEFNGILSGWTEVKEPKFMLPISNYRIKPSETIVSNNEDNHIHHMKAFGANFLESAEKRGMYKFLRSAQYLLVKNPFLDFPEHQPPQLILRFGRNDDGYELLESGEVEFKGERRKLEGIFVVVPTV